MMKLKIFMLSILLIAAIAVCRSVYKSDAFQLRFFPVEYWNEQVRLQKEVVETLEIAAVSVNHDLELLQRDKAFEIRSRRPVGLPEPDATRAAMDDYNNALADARTDKEHYISALKSARKNLLLTENNLRTSFKK